MDLSKRCIPVGITFIEGRLNVLAAKRMKQSLFGIDSGSSTEVELHLVVLVHCRRKKPETNGIEMLENTSLDKRSFVEKLKVAESVPDGFAKLLVQFEKLNERMQVFENNQSRIEQKVDLITNKLFT